jgi:hypothetical protein
MVNFMEQVCRPSKIDGIHPPPRPGINFIAKLMRLSAERELSDYETSMITDEDPLRGVFFY